MHDLYLFGELVLAAVLGFVIGWERRIRGQLVGDRTFALVCSGSAAFTVLGVDAFPVTAEKLIAGVITGIGFLGAGLILHTQEGGLRGLTTAAAVWSTSAVGVLVGGGKPLLGALFALLTLLILEIRYLPGARLLDARRWEEKFRSDLDEPEPIPPKHPRQDPPVAP